MRQVLFIFNEPAAAAPWEPLHDGVMGGLSEGELVGGKGAACFAGTLSLANHGGFASVKTLLPPGALRNVAALVLKVRGDGRRYTVFLKTHDGPEAGNYKSLLDLPAGEWHEVRLPLSGFAASLHGKPDPSAPPLRADAVRVLGLMVADGRAGPFRLEVAGIAAGGGGGGDKKK